MEHSRPLQDTAAVAELVPFRKVSCQSRGGSGYIYTHASLMKRRRPGNHQNGAQSPPFRAPLARWRFERRRATTPIEACPVALWKARNATVTLFSAGCVPPQQGCLGRRLGGLASLGLALYVSKAAKKSSVASSPSPLEMEMSWDWTRATMSIHILRRELPRE